MTRRRAPDDVRALYAGVTKALDTDYGDGRRVGDCEHGVYLFYDYDGEPIYVGRTKEDLRTRVRRHLTGQRTDAVAKAVLDPFEVAEIEMWPFWELAKEDVKATLSRAEYAVYMLAVQGSTFSVILNEEAIKEADAIALPRSVRVSVLPDEVRRARQHPDIRIARRARTIASLARGISERNVEIGIRKTLLAQAQRLEYLARARVEELEGRKP